jgi:tetraprenyl-beta-curcumene synthase
MGGAGSPPRAVSAEPSASLCFARAACAYWLRAFPTACRELARWRELAQRIGDARNREQALRALAKRANMEGAAAFAAFAPRGSRAAVVRATVAFQTAYNYLDVLSEIGSNEGDRRQLHRPLTDALELSSRPCEDLYLAAVVQACRQALSELPSYRTAAPFAQRAAERVIAYQALSDARTAGAASEQRAAQRWVHTRTPPASGMRWWETFAAAGSSLGVHATIAAAAQPQLARESLQALHDAYFPWIGALHSLLDHLVDAEEDARSGQCNLIARYASPEEAATRMGLLTERALHAGRALPPAHCHELIVVAMASFYLSSPHAWTPQATPVAAAVLDALGPLAKPSLLVFRARGALASSPCAGARSRGCACAAVPTPE